MVLDDRLSEYLVAQRRAAGWSQEELAERSTVSVRTIRNLERGVIRNPRRASVDLLRAAFAAEGLGGWAAERPERWLGPRGDGEPLVGRAADLDRIHDLMRSERCVVLTGPGGVGKTRLALAAAHRLLPAFGDGVTVLEAGHLPPERNPENGDLDRLWDAVHAALRPHAEPAGTPCEPRAAGSPAPGPAAPPSRCPGDGPRRLLVIDNADHVTETLTRLSRPLLADRPELSLIVSSRRPISSPIASSWEVGPLAVTGGERPDAVELFLRRARAACPTLDLTAQLGPIRALCAKLDGIPFAIELAALRLRSISLDRLLREQAVAQIIDQPRPTGLPHQHTLADSVRWSYDLLNDDARGLLHRLAGLGGAFTIEDAERACRRDGAPVPDLVGPLADLVESSLVQVRRGPRYSYRLLGYVREIVNALGADRPAPAGADGSPGMTASPA
ncbi:helix-turn-helix domain-containing protein [Actinomadura fibrosa]|uniref:Helix-turn-helix domain-containing protein n=1 Tax=Actinomadura fibrosa TaxID=111802 RepID=A0ABW2Y3A8_9ACTN|nr:helix-turn-helix domain-containing protein [Actinomadura fibrosa]